MSLTSDFLANYQKFMKNKVLLIPAQIPPKDGRFEFVAQGANAALLQTSTQATNIHGYYVHPIANNNNTYTLPTPQSATYYMLTDAMNGCQFIAYGKDRQNITVEHNNFISDSTKYAARLAAIKRKSYPYFFHISRGDKNDIPHGTYNFKHGVSVLGVYTNVNGWRFWVRDRLDQAQGSVYGPI